jgi:hypothetical protein
MFRPQRFAVTYPSVNPLLNAQQILISAILMLCFLSTLRGQEAPACQTAVLSALANTTCTRGDVTITYPDLDHILSATASGGAPLLTADDVQVVMDPGGPNAILMGAVPWGSSWSVSPGQKITATVNFILNAPQGKTGIAQLGGSVTGDAQLYVANIIITDPLTISGIVCNAELCPMDNWGASFVHFTPGRYSANATFLLDGTLGTGGEATLQELSEHFW